MVRGGGRGMAGEVCYALTLVCNCELLECEGRDSLAL